MEVYRGGPSEQRSGDLSLHLAPPGIQESPTEPQGHRVCCPSLRGLGGRSAARPVLGKWHLCQDSDQGGDFQDLLSFSAAFCSVTSCFGFQLQTMFPAEPTVFWVETLIWLLVLFQTSPLTGWWLVLRSALLGSRASPSAKSVAWGSGSHGLHHGPPRRAVYAAEILKPGLFVRSLLAACRGSGSARVRCKHFPS